MIALKIALVVCLGISALCRIALLFLRKKHGK